MLGECIVEPISSYYALNSKKLEGHIAFGAFFFSFFHVFTLFLSESCLSNYLSEGFET